MANSYFLKIDGIDGGSFDKNHKGWFEIDAYDFEVFREASLGGGGGGGKSVTTFSPLAVTAELGTATADLFRELAANKVFKSIELEGVNSNGDVFYDLALTNAVILKVDEGNITSDTVAFDYSKVKLTTTEFDSKGGEAGTNVFEWDLAAGSSTIDYSGIASLGDGTQAEVSTDKYFLLIDGITGDSTDKNHKGWFEIDAYDFEVFREISSGSGKSVTTFSPLVVTAELGAALADLFDELTSNKLFKSVELEGVKQNGNVFYNLELNGAAILKVDEGNDAKDTVAFDYQEVTVTTTSYDATGKAGIPHVFEWDLTAGSGTIDYDGIASLGDGTPAEVSTDKYFLFIDGIDGGSADKNHKGWFEIDAYDFEVFREVSLGGGGSSKSLTTSGPLVVTAELGAALADLFDDLTSNKVFKSIELEGVKQNGDVFYNLELTDAAILKVDEGNNAADTVAFDYQEVAITTTAYDATGKATQHKFQWDIAAGSGTIDDNGIASLGDSTPAEVSSDKYFLFIDGIDGGSTDKNHKGWFEIDAFDFEVFREAGLSGGGGGGKSVTTFSPLVVTAELGAALADLFDDLATNKIFKSVELEGVKQNGNVFYNLELNGAAILKVDEGNNAKDTVAFDYEELTVTTTPYDANGKAGTPHVFDRDLTAGSSTIDYSGIASLGDGTPAEVSTDKYFLFIEGIDGGSADKNHKGWFEIDAYDFEVLRESSLGGGGGGGKSATTFTPLIVTAELGTALSDLFEDLTSNKVFKSIELEGVKQNGDVFYNLELTDAAILKVDEGNNAKDTVAFDYQEVTVTTTPYDATGKAGTQHKFEWDLTASGTIDYSGIAGLGDGTPAEASTDKYFLFIDGIAGDSTDKNHKGWFEIDTFDFEVFRDAGLGGGGGGGGGAATFNPLVVTADLGPALAVLFDELTSGKQFKTVEIEGVKPQTGGVFYNLVLTSADIIKVEEDVAGDITKDTVSFSYASFSIDTSAAVIAVPGDAPGERGVATAASEHFVGTELSNPAKPWKLVTYIDSPSGVTVDLSAHTSAANTASGGFAAGDFFTDINAITGSNGNDSLAGNSLANLLTGGNGNDTFIIRAGDLVSGDTIDGGNDTDTVRIEGGGTLNLALLSLSNVENVTFTGTTGINVTATAAQAALISSAAGTTDIVTIAGNFNTDTALIKQLLDAGVEQVRWTSSVYGSATVLPDPEDATRFIVTYNDTDLTRPFDYLRTTYDANGNRVAQTQLFDTGLNNGVLHQQEYDPLTGGLISNVYIDSLNTRTFQSITTDFTNGIRTHTRTINDHNTTAATDDTIVDQYYDAAGVITQELTTDASPGGAGKPWVSISREYAGGVTQIFRTTYDNGNQQVLGTAGAQDIEGGIGADVLLGGTGADSFVFAPGFGNDTVHDYLDGTDKFDFTAFNVDTRAELQAIASITAAGSATLIDFGGGDRVTIRNLSPTAINDSDFILV